MLPQRAILLVRISDDRGGEGLGVARQEVDGRELAARLGWTIDEVIVENDTSAFKRKRVRLLDGTTALRVVRPGFRRSLDQLSSGRSDGLLAYDLDRVCRDPRDLEDLIDVVEQTRVPVTSVSGSLRLANDADITMARVMVAVANKASRDTSRRVARKHEELAKEGKYGGGGRRAFGYERDGLTIREDEAEAIREMTRIMLDGGTLMAATRYLEESGIRPPYAETWNSRSVKSTLSGPRIAGLRQFRGEVAGDAVWPAIIDRETWDELQVKLTARSAVGTGGNALRYWLTGVLHCGLCGRAMVSWQGNNGVRYWCASPRGGCGKIAIKATLAEAEIERQVLDYLARPEALAALRSAFSGDALAAARVTLAEDELQLKELARMWARKEISFAEYGEARTIIAARIKENKTLVTSSLSGSVRSLLSGDVQEGWQALPPAGRRDVVLSVVPGYRVMPAVGSRRIFEPDRMVPMA